jgi:hypothetical protein
LPKVSLAKAEPIYSDAETRVAGMQVYCTGGLCVLQMKVRAGVDFVNFVDLRSAAA